MFLVIILFIVLLIFWCKIIKEGLSINKNYKQMLQKILQVDRDTFNRFTDESTDNIYRANRYKVYKWIRSEIVPTDADINDYKIRLGYSLTSFLKSGLIFSLVLFFCAVYIYFF